MDVDLPAYFARIGYGGPSEPTLGVLQELHARHPACIPFDALDPFLGRAVATDIASVQAKLVHGRRGGYCYEQNRLFHDVLASIGFTVTPLAARVIWMRPGSDAPLTHRLTLVAVDNEPFVADVGFGPQNAPAPLRLAPGVGQPTSHGTYRIVRDGRRHQAQMQSPNGWMPLYAFTLDEASAADFEVANWFMSTHPRTRFVRNLVVTRLVGATRVSLVNASLTIRHPDGHAEQQPVRDSRALGDVLEGTMGLDLPVSPEAIWAMLPPELVPAWP